jgi:hypothetical protein
MSVALALFTALCDVGNALERLRDTYQPMTDAWLWHTEVLGLLDSCIDMLVHSNGIDDDQREGMS